MREIKFRAWDTKHHQMSVDSFGQADWGDYLVDFGTDNRDIADKSFIWLQYTGLLDKNGVEIYEGDILRNGARISWVRYVDEMAGFMDSDSTMLWESLGGNRLKHTAVVGNVYENPELLEAKS